MQGIVEGTLYREPNAPAGTPPLTLFFTEAAVKDERASKGGPPIYDRVMYVKVVVAGRADEGPIYEIQRTKEDGLVKVDESVYKRFGKPFEEWRAGHRSADAGTPLEQWPLMDVTMVAALRQVHVYSVQQLAEMSDGTLDQAFRRGGREWRAKAQAWLEQARTAAGDVEARAEIAELREALRETQALLQEALQKQNTPGYDKPRRKNREESNEVELVMTEDRRL